MAQKYHLHTISLIFVFHKIEVNLDQIDAIQFNAN
jgi:hypothetical protein